MAYPVRTLLMLMLVIALSWQPVRGEHTALPDGVTPVMATWLWGYHTVPASITVDDSPRWYAYPHTDAGRINNPPWTEVAGAHMRPGAKAPAVLVLHGCSGMPRGPTEHRLYLLGEGYAVFEPDSFARPGRLACDNGGDWQKIMTMRGEEIAYALAKIRELTWIDQERIVLLGISEGGRAVASWGEPGFAAHVILMAACGGQRGHPNAPAGTPVLAVVGGADEYNPGARCVVDRKVGGSDSVVIADAPHGLMDRREMWDSLDAFLTTCCQ